MENASQPAASYWGVRSDVQDARTLHFGGNQHNEHNQYDTARKIQPLDLGRIRTLDEQPSNHSSKKLRLNYGRDGAHDRAPVYLARPFTNTLPPPSSMQPSSEPGVRAMTALPERQEAGMPRFADPILDIDFSSNASLNGVPATWGPLSRTSHVHTIPSMVSPASDDSSRRSSGISAIATFASPTSSTGSTNRDGNMSSNYHAVHGYTGPMASINGLVSHGQPEAYCSHTQLMRHSDDSSGYHSNTHHAIYIQLEAAESDCVPATDIGHAVIEYMGPRVQDSRTGIVVEGGWTNLLRTETDTHTGSSTSAAALHHIINHFEEELECSQLVKYYATPAADAASLVNASQESDNLLVVADTKIRRPRSTFTYEKRQETSQTRALGACLRCKSQRIRCVPSPTGPDGVCATCEKVAHGSKKVLHGIYCVRWRLNDMSLYRHGGLNLTQRWTGTLIKDICNWDSDNIHVIEMKIYYSSAMHKYDLCPVPVKLRVRRFVPEASDVLVRKWSKTFVDANGKFTTENVCTELPPYALANTQETVDTLREYFWTNALRAMANAAKSSVPAVGNHMMALIRHYYSLPNGDIEKAFLERFFRLWFCIRFTTGSSYISGPDKLGCKPVRDPCYPLGLKISVPRMVTAQCDSIMVTRFLQPLSTEVLNDFEKIFRIGNPDHWFTLYACTFVLLHEVSFSSQDRHRHAVENWMSSARYSVSDFVKDLQFSANIILCYWHYYKTMDPTDEGWDIFCQIVQPCPQPRNRIQSANGKGKKKVHVTQEQCSLLLEHWNEMVDMCRNTQEPRLKRQFEHPLFFVSQMYIQKWQVIETYMHVPTGPPCVLHISDDLDVPT